MKVNYNVEVTVDTNDYVETLGEINDVLQEGLKGKAPRIVYVRITLPRSEMKRND